MTPAVEIGPQPYRQNLVSQPERDNPAAHGKDVRVVVLPRQPCRVQIIAERGANSGDFVGGDLLALPASAEHDPAFGLAAGDGTRDRQTDRRVVDGLLAVGPVIVDDVAEPLEGAFEMFLQEKPGVIRAYRNPHRTEIVLYGSRSCPAV